MNMIDSAKHIATAKRILDCFSVLSKAILEGISPRDDRLVYGAIKLLDKISGIRRNADGGCGDCALCGV